MARQNSFVRWAGGKSWFIPFFEKITKNLNYKNYFEPFAGGASIFFSCVRGHNAYLSDLNGELINAYAMVKEYPEELCKQLESMKVSEEKYYFYRDKYVCDSNIKKAARFLYLNHASFNGIYRVNKNGMYNVPYGKRNIQYNTDLIKRANLSLMNTELKTGDFAIWTDFISKDDLVFLDPPYSVSSEKKENGFIAYNQKLFSLEDQKRLQEFIIQIKNKKAYYILTNVVNAKIFEIFEECGDICVTLSRACVIGGKNAKREKVKEYVFTNIRQSNWGVEDGYFESIN